MINTSIAKRMNGQYFSKPLSEILNKPAEQPKEISADKVIADITNKAKLVVID